MGLTLQKFAEKFGEDASVICRIEKGERFPPKQRIKKFAEQLEALVAVERRKLDPCQMLPEISPSPVKPASIEAETDRILREFFQKEQPHSGESAVPVEDVIRAAYLLSTRDTDFAKEQITGPRKGALYGCLYPDGFQGKDRLVLVNSGLMNGRRLTRGERRVTIAHEAGHYFLHYGKRQSAQLLFRFTKEPTYCREMEIQPGEFNLREHQANVFAACLLMPRKQFGDERQRLFKSVTKLAERFDVTEALVDLRIKMLSL